MKPRCKSFDSKTEAEKWARELETQVDKFGAAPDTRILESTTLGALMQRYAEEVSPSKRGATQEIQRLGVLQRHDLAYRTLIGLSQQDIASFRDERLRTVKPATAVRELAILSHVLDVAMRDWGYPLAQNVVKMIRRPTINNARSRRLSASEEQRLLTACDDGRVECFRALVIVAIETGMRRGELLGLRWSDISHNRRVISLALTKNGTSREVPLSTRAYEALMSLHHNDSVDQYMPFGMTISAFDQTWKRVIKRSGIIDLKFHDLRHEAVSRFFELGLNVMEVSTISGHKALSMLKRYTHLSADSLVSRLG